MFKVLKPQKVEENFDHEVLKSFMLIEMTFNSEKYKGLNDNDTVDVLKKNLEIKVTLADIKQIREFIGVDYKNVIVPQEI